MIGKGGPEQLLASPMFADLLLKSPQLRSDISPLTQLLTTPVPDLLPAAPATRRKPRAADAALMSVVRVCLVTRM